MRWTARAACRSSMWRRTGSSSTTRSISLWRNGCGRSIPTGSARTGRPAWHHVRAQTHSASVRELARSTADLLFLIDNPVVREAMFPTTAHRYSVEPARPEDMPAIRALWTEHDPPEGAAVLDRWADLAPHAVRVVRDRSGGVAGCSVTCEWWDPPPSTNDPVVAAWLAHARRHPLPPGQKTLVHRRALAVGAGEAARSRPGRDHARRQA